MYPYTQFYIKVREGNRKKIVSDLIGGEFCMVEAINKFMQIHFPENRVYVPIEMEPDVEVRGSWYNTRSVTTDIGIANKLWIYYKDE